MSKKRNHIVISETESESEPESGSESESFMTESDDEDVEEINSSNSSDDDDEDDYEDYDDDEYDDNDDDGDGYDDDNDVDTGSEWDDSENEEEDDVHVDNDDGDFMFNKVIQYIRGKSDLQQLKLAECKVYLRRHGLRLSGTKEECIERIKEHWRLKDGKGESLYPRSSFVVDCTGDVCRGDVVLFSQKVYQSFDKVTRQGRLLGRRTVAGRIVKESYGAAKQQHTFTVEVLWSRGVKTLAPLFPLLVKGRNLYKLRTHRQYWKNEQERLKVLAEKHQRGAAARNVRAMRKTKMVTKTTKSSTQKGAKRSKHFHHLGPSGTKETSHAKKKRVTKHGNPLALSSIQKPRKKSAPFQASSSKQTRDLRGFASHRRDQNSIQDNQVREPPYLPYNPIPFNRGSSIQTGDMRGSAFPWRHQNLIHDYHVREPPYIPYNCPSQREPRPFPSNRGSSSTARVPYSSHSIPKPASGWQEYRRGNHSHSSHANDSKNFKRFPR
ncbi:hypothetical protein ACJIZ3_014868 [Penstemon smallii]|uniref:SAP domain-containing protein n=1 Tax=Penstemon smallii TaxID=265156 RepID=A0ABD3RUK1_9LAMI